MGNLSKCEHLPCGGVHCYKSTNGSLSGEEYRIFSYSFRPWIVSTHLSTMILGFPNSKKNSFRENYMRKYSNLHSFFDLIHFRELWQKYKNIFVWFLVQMKTSKFAFEIKWPLETIYGGQIFLWSSTVINSVRFVQPRQLNTCQGRKWLPKSVCVWVGVGVVMRRGNCSPCPLFTYAPACTE